MEFWLPSFNCSLLDVNEQVTAGQYTIVWDYNKEALEY